MNKATRAAIKLAEEIGINIDDCIPSGKNGHVTVEDVEAAAGAASHGSNEEFNR